MTQPDAPTDRPAILTSTATVDTPRGGRYGKQLASHFSRRLRTEWHDETGTGALWFDDDRCDLQATPVALVLRTTTGSQESLERVEEVVGRHLVRFGSRDELVVTWVRPDDSHGGTFRNTDESPEGHTPPA